ncbi:hypothetical protein SynBIOSE41_03461 [Synechococcus sp. BIOS-E4-1]|uniref:hypothetical protein n=1 Tax=Synechococcus sp. BIOS-E4-1 TaxID=1400864 RepID=UPI00164613F3|nr:hypothetical protein [Synechococcus sp. BIOS-E4-1]QNI55934.1 hypothetical protein SynBIOSE41_03461 [Synechococcus sp. BIOS-E4-1]
MAKAIKKAPAGAVDRARRRALGEVEAPAEPAVLGTPAAAAPSAAPSGRFIQGSDGHRYPEEFFDLSPADQKRFKELIAERQQQTADENTVATVANGVLDALDSERKARKVLESQVATLLTLVEAQQRRMDQMDLQVQADKSTALLEQEAAIAQQVTNLSAIRAEAGQEAAQHQQEREQAAAEHRDQLEAQATAIDALSGSVKSTTALMEQRGNAVEAQLVAGETRQQKLEVSLANLEGQTDAWTDPITRGEVNTMATTAVSEQWRSQFAALVDAVAEELQIQFPNGVHAGRMDSEYVRRQKRDAALMAEQRQGAGA